MIRIRSCEYVARLPLKFECWGRESDYAKVSLYREAGLDPWIPGVINKQQFQSRPIWRVDSK